MKFHYEPGPRLNYQHIAPDGIKALSGVSAYNAKSIDSRLRGLLELRVSQINGCAYCVNLHSQEARHAGETQQRLDVLPVWHETEFYTPAERAALNWAEQVTRLGDDPVPDELFEELKRHFTEKEIVDITLVIATMNAWNRISISLRARPPKRT